MARTLLKIAVIIIIIGVLLNYYLNIPLLSKCDLEKCPYCFGKDYCNPFEQSNVTLKKDTIESVFNNFISVKNVYNVLINSEQLIVKQLGTSIEFDNVDNLICLINKLPVNCNIAKIVDFNDYEMAINLFLMNRDNELSKLKICSEILVTKIIKFYLNQTHCKNVEEHCLKNLWTILQINPEPLLLQLLQNFAVPKYYGACGRLIVVEDAGQNLNSVQNFNFFQRVYVAHQIVEAVIAFTNNHSIFRIYLTDVSPDNIVVDSKLNVKFIDLENVILTHKGGRNETFIHHSEYISEFDFAYSEEKVCSSEISDHNYYAICKLILSTNAPWPMMENGLLHTPPEFIQKKYDNFFEAIETCMLGNADRFKIFEFILNTMALILNEQ